MCPENFTLVTRYALHVRSELARRCVIRISVAVDIAFDELVIHELSGLYTGDRHPKHLALNDIIE